MKYINCNSSLSKIDDPSCRTDFRVRVADVNRVSPFAQKGASGKKAPNILLRDAEHLEHSPFGRRTSMRLIQISRKTCTTDIYAPLKSAGREIRLGGVISHHWPTSGLSPGGELLDRE